VSIWTSTARQLIDRLKNFFTEARLRMLPRAGARATSRSRSSSSAFPRSGTTLVEQTLSAHPRISPATNCPSSTRSPASSRAC
jgi:hypothetical protein